MRTMYDAVTPGNIPPTATMVAGYVDGLYRNVAEMRTRFPHAQLVGIAVSSHTNDGQVLDVERGDATPDEAPGWVTMRRAAHVDPTIYCNSSTWPAVRQAFHGAAVPEPHYWIAEWDGAPTIPAGAVAKQHSDAGPFDVSSVAPYWPGVDPVPAPTPAPPEDDMPYTPQQLVEFATQGALAALESQPGRDAGALAGLWWLDHALGGTTTPGMSPAQVGLVQDIHHLMQQLNATPAPVVPKAAVVAAGEPFQAAVEPLAAEPATVEPDQAVADASAVAQAPAGAE